MSLVVLIDVARLRPRNAIKRGDGSPTEPGQSPKHRALFFSYLSPLELVDHLVRLFDTGFCKLLGSVLTAKGFE